MSNNKSKLPNAADLASPSGNAMADSVATYETDAAYEAAERRTTRFTRMVAWITIFALVLLGGGATLIALLVN